MNDLLRIEEEIPIEELSKDKERHTALSLKL